VVEAEAVVGSSLEERRLEGAEKRKGKKGEGRIWISRGGAPRWISRDKTIQIQIKIHPLTLALPWVVFFHCLGR
jgi:hypothetical protein